MRNEEHTGFAGRSWEASLAGWLNLLLPTGRFQHVNGLVVELAYLTAKDYVESDPLDLDYLSTRQG